MKNFKQLSFILATAFILAALGIKMQKPEWQLYSNISIGVGVAFFLISLWFERQELMAFFSARSTRYGMNSVVMVILVLAIVVVGNWLISRHPWKYDTTKNKQFTLSSLTLSTLKDLKQPVKITAFFMEGQNGGESRAKMKDLLDNYSAQAKMLDVRLIDPQKDPRLTQQYGIETNGTTVLESGQQKTTISTTEEEDVTNAILNVTSSKQVTVYFLQGHGEPALTDPETNGYSYIVDALKKLNYKVSEIPDLIAKKTIPDDCSALVVTGPKAALLQPEIAAIEDYLNKGGRVVLLDDPQSDPSVAKLLLDYGVRPVDDTVIDSQYYYQDPAIPLILRKEGTPLTKEFNFQIFFPITRSFTYDEKAQGLAFTPVAESSPESWGETDKEKAVYDEGKDTKGPLTVALTVTKAVTDPVKRSPEMRLVVFGDANFVQNGFAGVPGNKQIFLNAVAWLAEKENLLHLPPRNTASEAMLLSNTQLNYIFLLVVVVLPAAVLIFGISVWLKRKKL